MTDQYRFLNVLTAEDVAHLLQKDAEYGSSWKKRGGVGAYMMTARKTDRIENMVEPFGYDIFAALQKHGESLLDDIRDLRRYLLLIENEWRARQEEVAALAAVSDAAEKSRRGIGSVSVQGTVPRARVEHPAPFGYQADGE